MSFGKGGSSAQPAAPDPVATAAAQGAANKETAIAQGNLNAINQVTPYGNLTWTNTGTNSDGTPQRTVTQTLSPQQQAILDESQKAALTYGQTGNALLDSVKTMLGTPVDLSTLGAAPVVNDNYRQQMRDALVQRAQPMYDRQRQQIETQLANQGIAPGSQAWNDAFQPYYAGLNDFGVAADLNAGNLAAQYYGAQQTARQNQINEKYLPRNQELNTLAALLSGSQVTAPQFVNTPQTAVAPTDVIGAQGQALGVGMNNYNQQMAQQNAMMGGLAGLGGAAIASKFWR